MKTCNICQTGKDEIDFYPRMSRCKVCHNVRCTAWNKAHPEKRLAAQIKWRAKPGSREKEIAAARRWQVNNPEQFKRNNLRSNLRRLYGLTLEAYTEMAKEQGGMCAICHKLPNRALDVDHNHETGKVRQLLCSNCNTLIGLADENVETLQAVIDYLTQHSIS